MKFILQSLFMVNINSYLQLFLFFLHIELILIYKVLTNNIFNLYIIYLFTFFFQRKDKINSFFDKN